MAKIRNRRPGRPKGSKDLECVDVTPGACPGCNATTYKRRAIIKSMDFGGVTADGRPYTRVVWRRCLCDCGQTFVEKSRECDSATYNCQSE